MDMNEQRRKESGIVEEESDDDTTYILPPMAAGDVEIKKKTLVLDLDETLVYRINPEDYGQTGKPAHFDFSVDLLDEKWMIRERVYLLKRPGVDDLLLELATSRSYEVVVFSAGIEEYVDAVVDKLLLQLPRSITNNFIPSTHRLGRRSCTYCLFVWGNYVKDLSKLGRDLCRVIIVDDKKTSYHFHPNNGILVSSWKGEDRDYWLFCLIPKLKDLANSTSDVRELLPPLCKELELAEFLEELNEHEKEMEKRRREKSNTQRK